MGIALLKKLNVMTPDCVKKVMAPIIRGRLINNAVFRNQYDELIKMDSMSVEAIEKEQFIRLKETLIHAYEHTKYYKNVFDEIRFSPYDMTSFQEMKQIPLLTKDEIKSNLEDILADDVNDFYTATTGGSSGAPLTVYLDRDSIYKERAFIYHFWSKYGYDYKKSKIATFRGVEFSGKISKVNPLYNEVLLNPFLLTIHNIESYIDKIKDFNAEFIHGYPSAIAHFCKLIQVKKIEHGLRIKAVFSISETCSEEQKKIIEDTLQCKVLSFYGHSERAVFAEQTDSNTISYEFNNLYGYTEICNHSDGNIICTGFVNRKLPLIRYAVDDEATHNGPKYTIEGHHSGERIIGHNQEEITQTALNFHDSSFDALLGYQIYQDKIGYATLRVIAKDVLSTDSLYNIKEALLRKTGSAVEWKVVQVDKLVLTKRGKCKMIIQNKCLRGGYGPVVFSFTPCFRGVAA